MKELFLSILNASLHGSIVIAAVLILRLVLKKAPRALFCLLWLLAGLRLVLPFEIESRFSLQPDMEPVVLNQTVVIPATAETPDVQLSLPQEEMPADTQQEAPREQTGFVYIEENGTVRVPELGDILCWVWLAGAAVMLTGSMISYFRLKRRLREAWKTEDGAWTCPELDTAFVLGILKPRIYLPAGLKEPERGLILNHERTHISRCDHISKLAGYWVLAVHWFNPLVWVGYACLCRDIEMACDERVVRGMDVQARKDYSRALLNCAGSHRGLAACPVAFGETSVKQRIVSVLNYRKPGFWVMVVAVVALVFVVACLMTSPTGLRLDEYAVGTSGSLTSADLSGGNWEIDLNASQIEELEEILRSIRISEEGTGERGKIGDYQLMMFYDNLSILQFSGDCSEVWVMGGVKREVLNPAALRRWIRETEKVATGAVVDREVSGEPFAAMDAPAEWLRGVSADMIREASAYERIVLEQAGGYSSHSQRDGTLTEETLTELIRILNQMPEAAVGKQKRLSSLHYGYLQTQMSARSGLSLTLHDDVNGLVVILRILDGEDMELIMTDDLEGVERNEKLDNCLCWEIGNQELLEFLQAFQADPTLIRLHMSSQTRPERNEEWGLTFSVENVTPGGLTLVCEQNGAFVDGELMTGGFFYLQRLTEGGAQVVPTLQEAAFTTEGWVISSGETYRWDTNWEWLYGKLEPGVYWLYKFVQRQEGSNFESWTAAVEFTITEEMVQGEKETATEYTEEEALARCREAIEIFQAQNTYCLMIERQMSGDILNDNATQLFYVSGEDWLRHCVIDEVDFIEEDWYLNKNGRQFTKYTTHHNHDGNGVDINTGWVEGPREENEIFQPWLRTFDLDAQPVDFLGFETDGNLETVTFRVYGNPLPGDDLMEVADYTVEFVFYRDSRTLHQVILRYTQTWSMRVSGEDTTGVGYMVATMTPNAAGEDMVLQMLEAMYNQAITN